MKTITPQTEGVRVFGAPMFDKDGTFERLPKALRDEMGDLEFMGRRCPGARVAFKTDSKKVIVCLELAKISADIGMSIYACQSANVYIGDRRTASLAGLVNPPTCYDTCIETKTFEKSGELEDITVWLPRNEPVTRIWFEIDDDARVLPPEPYKYPVPIVYYGSSITEGGCCSRLTNAYNAIISKRLDTDYINLGFSGRARGELCMAEYICSLKKSMLVLDYDYNSPSADHLEQTHEPFFKYIREREPELPVLMLTAPNPEYKPEAARRRDIIRRTYENAKNAGDKNVYFIDGATFYGDKDRDACTTDTIHPTDLGFYRMANVIEPVIKEILESL